MNRDSTNIIEIKMGDTLGDPKDEQMNRKLGDLTENQRARVDTLLRKLQDGDTGDKAGHANGETRGVELSYSNPFRRLSEGFTSEQIHANLDREGYRGKKVLENQSTERVLNRHAGLLLEKLADILSPENKGNQSFSGYKQNNKSDSQYPEYYNVFNNGQLAGWNNSPDIKVRLKESPKNLDFGYFNTFLSDPNGFMDVLADNPHKQEILARLLAATRLLEEAHRQDGRESIVGRLHLGGNSASNHQKISEFLSSALSIRENIATFSIAVGEKDGDFNVLRALLISGLERIRSLKIDQFSSESTIRSAIEESDIPDKALILSRLEQRGIPLRSVVLTIKDNSQYTESALDSLLIGESFGPRSTAGSIEGVSEIVALGSKVEGQVQVRKKYLEEQTKKYLESHTGEVGRFIDLVNQYQLLNAQGELWDQLKQTFNPEVSRSQALIIELQQAFSQTPSSSTRGENMLQRFLSRMRELRPLSQQQPSQIALKLTELTGIDFKKANPDAMRNYFDQEVAPYARRIQNVGSIPPNISDRIIEVQRQIGAMRGKIEQILGIAFNSPQVSIDALSGRIDISSAKFGEDPRTMLVKDLRQQYSSANI